MSLTLKVLAYKGSPTISPIQAEFGPLGGTIGRKAGNTLVLPDHENIVSGKHAEIIYQNGQFMLRDTSTNGTVLVDSGVTLNSSEAMLRGNETLRIGEYEVSVQLNADPLSAVAASPALSNPFDIPAAPAFSDPFAAQPAPAPFSFDTPSPFPDANAPVLEARPLFADAPAFAAESPTFAEPPAFSTGPTFAETPVFHESAPSSPFNDSFVPPATLAAEAPASDISELLKGLDALSGLSATPPPATEPAVVQSASVAEPNPFADFPAAAPVTASLSEDQQREADDYLKALSDANPFASFSEAAASPITPAPQPAPVAATPPPPAHPAVDPAFVAAPAAAVTQPIPAPPQPQAPVTAPVQAPPATSISEQQLVKLFLAGAGIHDPHFIADEHWPQTMQTVGQLFRALTEGLMEVLRARAEMKSQFRVSMTTIRTLDNNPLKFNPDVESVLKLMLAPRNPAFIDANDAVKEGFRDIKFHQLAMTAGIQASLAEILYRFNPENFEKILGEGLVFQKKARCWEQFCEKYPELKNQAMEEFFGDAFVEAYEKQMNLFGQR